MNKPLQRLVVVMVTILLIGIAVYYFKAGKTTPSINSNPGIPSLVDNGARPSSADAINLPIPTPEGANPALSNGGGPGFPQQALAQATPPGVPGAPGAPGPDSPALPPIGPAPAAPGGATQPAMGSYGMPSTQPYPMTGPSTLPAAPDISSEPDNSSPAAETSTYTIKSGDSFSSIAKALFHNAARWKDIAQANPTVDPIKLHVGQVIKLPQSSSGNESETHGASSSARSTAGSEAANSTPARHYTVQYGDTLSTIARQFYHDRTKSRLIYQTNRKTIGASPDDLAPGMKLIIPAAPVKESH